MAVRQTDRQRIRQLTRLRTANNRHWMALVSLAFQVAPTRARVLFRRITAVDRQIGRVAQALGRVC